MNELLKIKQHQRELASKIRELIDKTGLDSTYVLLVILYLMYFFMYHKKLKNWDNLSNDDRFYYAMMVLTCLMYTFYVIVYFFRGL